MTDSMKYQSLYVLLSDLTTEKSIIGIFYKSWLFLLRDGYLSRTATKKNGRKAYKWKATRKGLSFLKEYEANIA